MKQVTAYASSQQLDTLMREFMNLGIQEIKTLNNYSEPAGISRIKLLCDETQVDEVRNLLSTITAANNAHDYYFSVQDVDQTAFLRNPM